jgi:hypothetical protein
MIIRVNLFGRVPELNGKIVRGRHERFVARAAE